MYRAGLNRQWVITEMVSLYQRSLEDVRSYSTARGCLYLLGSDLGLFGKQPPGIPAGEVAALMRAVADRGRSPLPRTYDAAQPTGEAVQQTPDTPS
jgi:hypothetical protein